MLRFALVAAILLAGCQSTPTSLDGGVVATFRSVSAHLPPSAPVPGAIAAADAVLTRRGYSVRTRKTSADSGTISAVPAEASWLGERVVVVAARTGAATRLTVRIEPLGDEPTARAILDSILARLGHDLAAAPPGL